MRDFAGAGHMRKVFVAIIGALAVSVMGLSPGPADAQSDVAASVVNHALGLVEKDIASATAAIAKCDHAAYQAAADAYDRDRHDYETALFAAGKFTSLSPALPDYPVNCTPRRVAHGIPITGHVVHNFHSVETNNYLSAWAFGQETAARPLPTAAFLEQRASESSFSIFLGNGSGTTHWTNQTDSSSGTPDPTMPDTANPHTGSIFGGVGIGTTLFSEPVPEQPTLPRVETEIPSTNVRPTQQVMYAPEDKPASGFPYVLPTKAPPKPPSPPPSIAFGVEGNVYFFAGGNATINGIPGGPGITPTGNDSFNFKDRYLFTAGGVVTVPINAALRASLTGGFAEADKSVTYNCGTYCTTGGVTPFSVSKDVWLPGAYVGGRVEVPLAIAPWPGTTIGFDYKHIFLASENLMLGNVAVRAISQNVSQDIDMFAVRLAVPFGGH